MQNQNIPPDVGDVDTLAARRFFGRSLLDEDGCDALTREVERRMAERLDYVRLEPTEFLDAGTGNGRALTNLGRRYPNARAIGIDSSQELLAQRRKRRSILARAHGLFSRRNPRFVCADFSSLPFKSRAFQLVWSNLALPWAPQPIEAFKEFHRILGVGGLAMFSTYGPDTLKELREAFSAVDGLPHTLRFPDMHDLGDLLIAAGFSDPVMDMEMITLTYPNLQALVRDLRVTGQVNSARGRPRGLMGRAAYQSLLGAYERMRVQGQLPVTVEVIYGHAWKGQPRLTRDGYSVVKADFGVKKSNR